MNVFAALAYLLDLDRWPRWAKRAWLLLLPITLPIWCVLWILKVILVIAISIPLVVNVALIIIVDKIAGRKLPAGLMAANEKDADKDKDKP